MAKKKPLTSDGIQYTGEEFIGEDWTFDTLDNGLNVGTVSTSYTVDGIVDPFQMSMDFDQDLRKKYPALQDAWEHYHNVKKMCESKEQEENEN